MIHKVSFDLRKGKIEDLEKHDLPLIEAFKDLKDASLAFEKMVEIGITNFHAYDRAWREFLQSIDRVWNKVESKCHEEKKWPRMKSKYEGLRRKDPLLKYIIQARNATEHSISPVVKEWDANLRVTPKNTGLLVEWDQWDRPLLPVTNRGTTFHPPKKHRDKPISHYRRDNTGEAIIVAELAMRFYIEMVNEISREVFGTVGPASSRDEIEASKANEL